MARQRPTRLVMGPFIVEIDRIVIKDVQYQFEVNRCRNEEFQGSMARTDRRTDGQTAEITTIFSKSVGITRPYKFALSDMGDIHLLKRRTKILVNAAIALSI
ncbi:hypothetical protein DPMN_030927 [Dreissena polymorpha]|uniref:Uncharacterized protein n=1 Tax=Dreissena polymorpha TaxID=45954 RepID=A0A9D4M0W7_DREPO|nr:hypothetical protein DPMN_030927 [Dreissena polymorpha]